MTSVKENTDKTELVLQCECGRVHKITLDEDEKPKVETKEPEVKKIEKRSTILFKKVD